MDIAALSVILRQNAVRQQAGIAIMKEAMENMEANSHAMVEMMEQSVNPHIGANVDVKV